MGWINAIFLFSFGAIIGSFLNVIILRYNTGLGFSGRSKCFSCGRALGFFELAPVLSFLFLSGRCAGCKSRISLQYPLVETAAGFLLLALYIAGFSGAELFYVFASVCLLVVVFAYDMRHKIIPDGIVFLFILLSFFYPLIDFNALNVKAPDAWHLFSGPMVALPFFLFWFFSSGRWMGLGDGKLALGIGWFLGAYFGFSAVVFSVYFGAVFGLCLILANAFKNGNLKKSGMVLKSEVPFAPFLIAGFLVTLFFGLDFLNLQPIAGF